MNLPVKYPLTLFTDWYTIFRNHSIVLELRTSFEILKIEAEVNDLGYDFTFLDTDCYLPNLRKFSLSGSIDVFCFAGLGRACTLLETVEIICDSHSLQDVDDFCERTADEFLPCPFLKEWYIDAERAGLVSARFLI